MPLDESTGSTVRRLASPCLLLCLYAGCAKHPPAAPGPAPEAHPLQGYWEVKGQSDKTSMTIDGDSLYLYARPDFQFDTTITLAAGTDPPQLHATIRDSPRTSGNAGEVVFVIYKIEDETLTMAVVDESDEAPPSFLDAIDLYEFEKVQPRE